MRATEFLVEYKRDITAQNYAQALINRIVKDPSMASAYRGLEDSTLEQQRAIVDGILKNFFEVIDPTQNKQYVQWLVRMYANGQIKRLEDVTATVAPVLDKFHRLKVRNLLPAHIRDINQFKTITQFYNAVGNLSEPAVELKDKGQAEEIFRNEEMRIIKPIDQAAACYYGQGTRWCTAATNSRNMFNNYNQDGPLYIVVPTQAKHPGEKYQLHFQSEQYMDEKDDPVKLTWLINERFPSLKNIVVQLAGDPDFAFSMHLLSDAKFNGILKQCADLAEMVIRKVSEDPAILDDQYHARRIHSFLMVIEDRINSNITRDDIAWTFDEHSHSGEYDTQVSSIPMLYYRYLRDGEKELYYQYNYPRDWFNVDIKPFYTAFKSFSDRLRAAINSGEYVVESSIAWRRGGNKRIKPKFRCSSGPRAGRVVSDLAQCSEHPNPAKAAKMKLTRARTKVRAAKRSKKTKRVNPFSKLIQALNKAKKK